MYASTACDRRRQSLRLDIARALSRTSGNLFARNASFPRSFSATRDVVDDAEDDDARDIIASTARAVGRARKSRVSDARERECGDDVRHWKKRYEGVFFSTWGQIQC
jgi:hypothetical protein